MSCIWLHWAQGRDSYLFALFSRSFLFKASAQFLVALDEQLCKWEHWRRTHAHAQPQENATRTGNQQKHCALHPNQTPSTQSSHCLHVPSTISLGWTSELLFPSACIFRGLVFSLLLWALAVSCIVISIDSRSLSSLDRFMGKFTGNVRIQCIKKTHGFQ